MLIYVKWTVFIGIHHYDDNFIVRLNVNKMSMVIYSSIDSLTD